MIVPPNPENILLLAVALRRGELVVMPTETVYGLAGDALNEATVRSIFQLKGRPAENPLIVHVASLDQVAEVAIVSDSRASLLAESFWPGPLTLVLPRRSCVPEIVSAGRNTVAVRVPRHPVALSLIESAARPLAAPSANTFMALSPTAALHVSEEIGKGTAAILDGGPCEIGIESTVLDLSGEVPEILRPGYVTATDLEPFIGPVKISTGQSGSDGHRSPGQYPRHYAPRTPLRLAQRLEKSDHGLTLEAPIAPWQMGMPNHATGYASTLYAALHGLDLEGIQEIVVQRPPETEEWVAVWDRLTRMTTK